MRIDLFKLNIPEGFDLANRLTAIQCLEHQQRNRKRDNQIIRLETLQQENQLWFCDFVKVRMDHGPGKAALNKPITGFDLDDDEGFGEETGLLWDASTNYCLIQYNHHGPRETAIAEYIALWDHEAPVALSLAPKLDESIHAKLKNKSIVRKFTISCAPKRLSNADYDNGMALGSGIASIGKTDADLITITISVRGKKSKSLDLSLPAIAEWLTTLGSDSKDFPIKSARATAKGTETEAAEVLDLLHHKITTDKSISPGKDKRYSMKDRWACLRAAYYEWKPLLNS